MKLRNEKNYICQADVDKAVNAAKRAFHRNSEWRKMDPYARGELMNKVTIYASHPLLTQKLIA